MKQLLESYKYKLEEYNKELDRIKKDIMKTIEYFQKSLLEMKGHNSTLEKENDINNNQFHYLIKCNNEKNVIVKLIENYNKQIDDVKSTIGEQVEIFYNNLFQE